MSAESLSLTRGGGTIGSRKKRKHRLQKELNAYARAGMKLWLNVEAVFQNESLKKVSFSGNLKRYDDFEHIVSMLEMTGGIRFKVEGRKIFITEK